MKNQPLSAIANGAVIADNSSLVLQGFASKLDDSAVQNSNPMQIAQYSAGTSVPNMQWGQKLAQRGLLVWVYAEERVCALS